MDRKQIGRIGLGKAINYYTILGYTVFLPINDTLWYDLIIEKDGNFQTVQCKATATEEDTIDLRETGGTSGELYGHVLEHQGLNLLFCVNKDLDIWIIPIQDLKDNNVKNTFRLRKEISKNNQGFQSYSYYKGS